MDNVPPLPPNRTGRPPVKNLLVQQMFDQEKKTIGGLLLLFCMTRTVISPIYLAIRYYFLFQTLGGVGTVFSRFPFMYLLLGLDVLLGLLGIWSGILIWDLKARGVRLARIYLVLGMLLPVVLGITAQMVGQGELAAVLGNATPSAVIMGSLWLIYLWKSERVKNLYDIEATRQAAA